MKRKTGLLSDPIYRQHKTGMHPESPDRLTATLDFLQSSTIWDRLELVSATEAERDTIELVHDSDYIADLERQIKSGREHVHSPDCSVSSETFKVALNAVGGAIELVERVLSSDLRNGFGLVRPPGHHAEQRAAMGFCFFNNIAICAEHLIRRKGCGKILIVDFDVHHGNGTQHFFENRSDVFYCSVHESPFSCYPGTGFDSEKGNGEGQGYTLNVSMEAGSGDREYLTALEKILLPAWESYQPEFVLVSAGFDAHIDDPLANIRITEETFSAYTKALCQIAETHCGGKLVSLLEGGYNLGIIPRLIESHLAILLDFADRQSKTP